MLIDGPDGAVESHRPERSLVMYCGACGTAYRTGDGHPWYARLAAACVCGSRGFRATKPYRLFPPDRRLLRGLRIRVDPEDVCPPRS